MTNQKYWAAVKSNLLHFFLEVHTCVAHFTSHGKLHEFGAEKPISWAKQTYFDLFTINCSVWSHILSTGGECITNQLDLACTPLLDEEIHHSGVKVGAEVLYPGGGGGRNYED